MTRIAIVGPTGSGKTTLARAVSARLQIPHIDMDSLFWGRNWTPVEQEIFLNRVNAAISQDSWITDGNYHGSGAADLIWRRAEIVVWLDLPLRRTLPRLLRRTIERIRTGEELWPDTGNFETFRTQFLSKDSLFVWALHQRRSRGRYWRRMQLPEYRHVQVERLTTPRHIQLWFAGLPPFVEANSPASAQPGAQKLDIAAKLRDE